MSMTDIISKIDEIKELESLINEAQAEADALRDSIKAEMLAQNVEEMEAGQYIVRWNTVISKQVRHYRIQEASRGALQELHEAEHFPPLYDCLKKSLLRNAGKLQRKRLPPKPQRRGQKSL